jgi:tetratricopeptide (TPR) repeat protein
MHKGYPHINSANNKYYIYIYINIIKGTSFLTILFFLGLSTCIAQNHPEIQLANEYLIQGEKKKALVLFQDLSKKEINLSFIYDNYFNLLLQEGNFDDAENIAKKISKKDPANLQYVLDIGLAQFRAGALTRADKYFKEIIAEHKTNFQLTKLMADYFSARNIFEYGILALKQSRETLNNPSIFALELAMLYRLKGEQDKMVNEYLNYVTQTSANIQYVKNILQMMLTQPSDLESLEKLLIDRVQQNPEVEVYAELLIWTSLQQKNFYSAFIQARALDKRYKYNGDKTMEVARLALQNDDYENAQKIYRYVIKEFPNTPNYFTAKLGFIQAREAQIKNQFPVNIDSVKNLSRDYATFIKEYPENQFALEATRNRALLFTQFLNQNDSAIKIFTQLISNPRASNFLKSKAKLDLGDVYVLQNEPWESTLLYSQVEKAQKESALGYEAKLKNAKLSYYRGNFKLAQEHLDILKQATTREIANDALALSLLIKENLLHDSTGAALKEFAEIELTLSQHNIETALKRISNLQQGYNVQGEAVTVSAILDDLYWLEADIHLKNGRFELAIEVLQKIIDQFPDDVWADDAFFKQGEIYDIHLKDREKAMDTYFQFLTKFPNSVHTAQARKRYRILRGDFSAENPKT